MKDDKKSLYESEKKTSSQYKSYELGRAWADGLTLMTPDGDVIEGMPFFDAELTAEETGGDDT